MLCKIWGFHGGDYEERCLLGYKNPVRTPQETYYVSATEPSRLMLCKIWGFHCGDYEECRLLGHRMTVKNQRFGGTSIFTRGTQRHIPEDGISYKTHLPRKQGVWVPSMFARNVFYRAELQLVVLNKEVHMFVLNFITIDAVTLWLKHTGRFSWLCMNWHRADVQRSRKRVPVRWNVAHSTYALRFIGIVHKETAWLTLLCSPFALHWFCYFFFMKYYTEYCKIKGMFIEPCFGAVHTSKSVST
jgi:hypothetical protein